MKYFFAVCFVVSIISFATAQNGTSPHTVKSRQKHLLTDNMYFVSVNFNENERQGKLTINSERTEIVNCRDLYTIGISVGKRFALPLHLRLSVPISFDYGSVLLDSLHDILLRDGYSYDVIKRANYHHIGLTPALQYPIPLTKKAIVYLSCGGGINGMFYTQFIHRMESYLQRVTSSVSDSIFTFCFSADVGAGVEFLVRKNLAVALEYSFKYWEPVHYNKKEDLFPLEALPYRERFLTHSLHVRLLFR